RRRDRHGRRPRCLVVPLAQHERHTRAGCIAARHAMGLAGRRRSPRARLTVMRRFTVAASIGATMLAAVACQSIAGLGDFQPQGGSGGGVGLGGGTPSSAAQSVTGSGGGEGGAGANGGGGAASSATSSGSSASSASSTSSGSGCGLD